MNVFPRELWEIILNYCGNLNTVDTFRVLSKDCNVFIEEYFHMMYLKNYIYVYRVLRCDKLKHLIYFDCSNCINNDYVINNLTKLKKLIHCKCDRIKNTKFKKIYCNRRYCYRSMHLKKNNTISICLNALKNNY